MKSHSLFSGVILVGFGLYYLLEHLNIVLFQNFHSWPTLLGIVGIAFLVQAFKAKHYDSILPGIIFFGFGIHFHVISTYQLWTNDLGVFILIIALGLLLQANKSKASMLPGILLLIVSLVLLFNERILNLLGLVQHGLTSTFSLWALILIGLGALLLFIKK